MAYPFVWSIEEVKNFLKTNEATEQNVQNFLDTQVIPNRVAFLMVEDLEQLKKGGRISGAKAVIAKIFKIKPVILFDKNGLTNIDRAKDDKDLFDMFDKYLAEHFPGKKIVKCVLIVPFDETRKNAFVSDYTSHYGSMPYDLAHIPTIIACHTGLKYVAIYVEMK